MHVRPLDVGSYNQKAENDGEGYKEADDTEVS